MSHGQVAMKRSSTSDTAEEKLLLGEELITPEDELSASKPKRHYGMLLTVIFLQFISRAADTVIYPFFPEAATNKGLSMAEVGIIFSAYDFSRFISSPIFGSLLLKWPPKSMCAVGTVVTGLSCASLGTTALVNNREWFLGLCIVIRFIAGTGSIMITISSTSILLKASGFKTGTIVAIIETETGVAYTVGPAMGATLYELVGYSSVFWVFGGLLLVGLPFFLYFVPYVVESEGKGKKNFLDLLSIPGCILMFVSCMLTRINGGTRNFGVSDYIVLDFHKSASVAAVILAVCGGLYLGSCAIIANIASKFPSWNFPLMISSYLIFGVFWMFMGPSPLLDFIFHGHRYFWLTVSMVVVAVIPPTTFNILAIPATLDLVDVNGHPRDSLHTYGMVTGLAFCGWGLGSTTGPTIAGAIIDALNYQWLGTILSFTDIAMGLLIVTYLLYMRLTNQPIAPSADQSTNKIPTDQTDTKKLQVADACHDRMDKYLKNSGDLTKIHHQQPVDELNK